MKNMIPGHIISDLLKGNDNEEILKAHRARLLFDKKAKDELLREAVSHLEKAKEIHDELESFYIEAMNFEEMNTETEGLINKIIG